MRTVTTAEELDALPQYTVVDAGGNRTYVAVRTIYGGNRWYRVTHDMVLSSGEIVGRFVGPFEVVASPEPDGLHDLATACASEDWQHVARRLSRESTDRDVRDVAEALERTFLAVKHNYDEVERSHKQLDEAHKRIDELENPDVPTVDGWSRQEWLDHAGKYARTGGQESVGAARVALQIAEAMREGDV